MSIKSSIIIRPILSEKGAMLSETQRKYVFQVEKAANKLEIKKAVEDKFNVKVDKVATLNFKGKRKNTTVRSNGKVLRTSGTRSSWKKAIITLSDGFSIDLLNADVS
jgi:large subunit ribosomal protein L23